MRRLRLLFALPLLLAAGAPMPPPGADPAWSILEGLTTEIGPRPAGSDAEARARAWAVARLTALGFSNVRVEPFDVPYWARGTESAAVTAPFPQPLAVTALGNSGATPPSGLEAPVAAFASLAALDAAPAEAVAGRIVYVGHAMAPTQDGSGYGQYGAARFRGPAIAAGKGAAAIIIRSIGTDRHRLPHTGQTVFPDGVAPIPAAALANPDADQLERIVARGRPVRLRLVLTPLAGGQRPSGNVIAEVPGTDPAAGIVAIGGHLDSWDLGTGAIDNAAGVAITAAAARRILDERRPRRTIRLIWFGAEEIGGLGGRAYFERHRAEPHALVAESDFGADRIWRFQTRLPAAAAGLADRLEQALAPFGIVRGRGTANAGADLGPWARAGTNAIDLNQDGTRYFDLHHTADDTIDKIDPAQLEQNVAAWTAMLRLVGDAPEDLLNQNSLTGTP